MGVRCWSRGGSDRPSGGLRDLALVRVDGWRSEDGGAVVFGGEVVELVALLDGWVAEAHNHTGLAVAAAGGGEGGMRREGCVTRPPGDRRRWLGI